MPKPMNVDVSMLTVTVPDQFCTRSGHLLSFFIVSFVIVRVPLTVLRLMPLSFTSLPAFCTVLLVSLKPVTALPLMPICAAVSTSTLSMKTPGTAAPPMVCR